jgi:hypothetical protein
MIPSTAKRREATLSARSHSHPVEEVGQRQAFTHRGAEPA